MVRALDKQEQPGLGQPPAGLRAARRAVAGEEESLMQYYMVRWECDTGCGEVEDTEESLPLGWVRDEEEQEDLCESCAKARGSDRSGGGEESDENRP